LREPLPYLERNHAIVNESDFLIAAPDGPETLRSGTWATVRYARKVGKRVLVIMPNGEILP
jgi:predicted Rossmann fold nucleotide-binding protein DprA/Smf involved in DNA uptake